MSLVLVALTSAKGSPGVTTATVALAATTAAGYRGAVLEVDPSGGDLGPAFGLAAEPGLVTLASAARRDHRPGLLWQHTQKLPGGLAVVAAPVGAEQAASAVDVLLAAPALRTLHGRAPGFRAGDEGSEQVGGQVAERDVGMSSHVTADLAGERDAGWADEGLLWVDAGRLPTQLARRASVARLLGQADVVLLVVRNDLTGIAHAAARLASVSSVVEARRHGSASSRLRLLLVGTGGYPAAEVSQALQTPVAGTLPWDPRAAAVLSGQPGRRVRKLGRLPLLRAAAAIGTELTSEPRHATGAPDEGGRPRDPRKRHEPPPDPWRPARDTPPDRSSGSASGSAPGSTPRRSGDGPAAAARGEEARR